MIAKNVIRIDRYRHNRQLAGKRYSRDIEFRHSNAKRSRHRHSGRPVREGIPIDIITFLILNMAIIGYMFYKAQQRFATLPWYLIVLFAVAGIAYAILIWIICDFYLVDKGQE
jgi:hypothetical protein